MHAQRGFTLVEMLIAMAIFAAIGLVASLALQSQSRSQQQVEKRRVRLAEVQLAFNTLENDIPAIVARKDRSGAPTFSAARYQLKSEDWALTFTRNGWLNPFGLLPRSQLQRVSYRLEKGTLMRDFFRVLDPVAGDEPVTQRLLTQVRAFHLRFYAENGWQDSWSAGDRLPEAIEVTLALADYGDIPRIFLLTTGALR
ncbi:TPA: type II secretion system minor pseudopilin GspJ [Kluyvera ascorbata]|uniref:type II secretion system minor pseudopilin GspJ n=1 Tax=Kluyvera georgiana TaxID=73098 RepID=UPI0027FF45DC|nr:type II secretion system minor pseudopilin GspJ [Kluyvera ascorbata]HDT6545635.1 type II secretion system minor pseudopilin GspJ [Kluyvera ascorbata]